MIGLSYEGKTVSGFEQFKQRFTRVMTTQLGTRERHRTKGSNARKHAAKNNDSSMLMRVQNEVMTSVSNPINQLTDFEIERCVASRTSTGVSLSVFGKFNGTSVNFGTYINV